MWKCPKCGKTFKNTKEYANDIIIKDINTNIGNDNIIQISFILIISVTFSYEFFIQSNGKSINIFFS